MKPFLYYFFFVCLFLLSVQLAAICVAQCRHCLLKNKVSQNLKCSKETTVKPVSAQVRLSLCGSPDRNLSSDLYHCIFFNQYPVHLYVQHPLFFLYIFSFPLSFPLRLSFCLYMLYSLSFPTSSSPSPTLL